jgi:Fe-S-cluster-containing dehydrogenase component
VERHPRGRHRADRDVLRQHRRAGRRHVAARGLRRAAQTDRRPGVRRPPRAGRPLAEAPAGSGTPPEQATVTPTTPGTGDAGEPGDLRWLMASDVCKHCTHAACLDVCPTGALVRTEFGTVIVQEDVCNGCGYCIPACPYGVIDQREKDGRAFKCTLCYDRLTVGAEPACAKACPTDSIQFGELDELRERAARRVEQLHGAGVSDARARPARRRRGGRRLLPAPGCAGGLRLAAGPGGDHPRPARDVEARRPGRCLTGRPRRRLAVGEALVRAEMAISAPLGRRA